MRMLCYYCWNVNDTILYTSFNFKKFAHLSCNARPSLNSILIYPLHTQMQQLKTETKTKRKQKKETKNIRNMPINF
jgi:hypothetical protein